MKVPSHDFAFQVLLLQAADDGRGDVLFGESIQRVREAAPPFLVGEDFPDVYLEHPLIGEPFLDITTLYGQLDPGMRIQSAAAGEHGALIDWFADVRKGRQDLGFGFELDTKEEVLPEAAVHFQPRRCLDLVKPFFQIIGEPERAELYLGLDERMPEGWPLSFFGMFRGREAAPLRVCGYLDASEQEACADDPSHVAEVFDAIGFGAYDSKMISQISALMSAAPHDVDFQFDVYPDGRLGDIFAIDMKFGIEKPESVFKAFETGPGARVMGLLEEWGAADDRWKLAVRSAFARSIPVEVDEGDFGRYAFTLMPHWAKARWNNTVLQPSKLYHLARGDLLAKPSDNDSALADQ